jgi:hypothetical protein
LVVVSLVSMGHWLLGLLGLCLSSILGLFVSNAVTVLHAVGLGVWLSPHDYLEGRREVGIRADGRWSLGGALRTRDSSKKIETDGGIYWEMLLSLNGGNGASWNGEGDWL